MSKAHEALFIGSLCLGQFVTLAPIGQVLAPIQLVGQSFDQTDSAQTAWYISAFALTAGTFVLIGGGLGDRYGLKRCFLLALAWLGVWSLIAGCTAYTKSAAFFDVCRAMQGVGAAILSPNAMAIIGATYPPGPKKGIIFCLFGSMSATGFFATSIFASLLAEAAWWPWAFWIYTIVTAAILVAAHVSIPQCFMYQLHVADANTTPSLDWLGALTGTVGLILFNVAWNQAPTDGWSAPYVIVCLVLGVAALTVFVFAERKAAAPLVPVRELSSGVLLVLMCIMFGFMSFGVFLFNWWQFVEVIQGASPLVGVARHVPALISAIAAAGVVAALIMRVRSCWLLLGAMLAYLTANVLLATVDPDTLYWKQMFWTVVVLPFGSDMTFPAASLMMSNLVAAKHQGIAAGMIATIANYAVALGLGISNTVAVHFNAGGQDPLAGLRSAMYFSCGSAGLGLITAVYIVIRDYTIMPVNQDVEKSRESVG